MLRMSIVIQLFEKKNKQTNKNEKRKQKGKLQKINLL